MVTNDLNHIPQKQRLVILGVIDNDFVAHRPGRMLNDNVSTSFPLAIDEPLTGIHKFFHHVRNLTTLKPFAIACADSNAGGAEGLQFLALGTAAVRLFTSVGFAEEPRNEEDVTAQRRIITGFAAVSGWARVEVITVGRSEAQ